ncbi:hypothetical protein E5678_00175 [Hydrogenophaga sp. PAMC20947]|nr:hypothetical protein E5678_00175 [Hydrogenophaga sp. PAMC20947]
MPCKFAGTDLKADATAVAVASLKVVHEGFAVSNDRCHDKLGLHTSVEARHRLQPWAV